jgi:hypothetical protein
VRDDDLPTLTQWEMDPGRMATLPSSVAPPSQAAAKERMTRVSAAGRRWAYDFAGTTHRGDQDHCLRRTCPCRVSPPGGQEGNHEMTSDEHYRQAEDLIDRTDVIGALPSEQLAEAQVHATLALAATLQDIAAGVGMLREVIADLRT